MKNLRLMMTMLLLLSLGEVTGVQAQDISVVTLNNTNPNRGALIYHPSKSEKWVWSSGKGGTFNASNANSQWVFYPTGHAGEYYLYNVGARKFAIPTTGGTFNGYSWMFSHDAVAVTLKKQGDGTYKIFTASGNLCVSVSNGYEGPIISYDDIGAQFTLKELKEADETLTQEIDAAVGRLIHNMTPLAAALTDDGWYAIRIRKHASYSDQFIFLADEEIKYNGIYYPLGFYSASKVRPAIDNSLYYAKLTAVSGGHYWQLPNGRFIQNGKPVSGVEAALLPGISYSAANGFTIKSSSYYYVPFLLGGLYFIGETSSSGRAYYDLYPVSLADAGLTAWQVFCDHAPEKTPITCLRSDVSGLTSVYKNGYFFLPSDVTPVSSDFTMPGAQRIAINATTHTITITYDTSIAIVAEGVSVYQGYGTTGLGNEKAVLLRMQVAPFSTMENAVMTFSLTNSSYLSAVTVYETDHNVEFNAISNYTNTFSGSIHGSTATVPLGTVAAGTHDYWLCATIAEDAKVGDVIDAALTSITYDYNGNTGTTCDLTAVGNPANSMKIFGVQSYPFYPGLKISGSVSNYYRIPALANVKMPNGVNRIFSAVDKRYNSASDIGGGHVIDIVVRYSDDGGRTWSPPVTIAKGNSANDATCGYGDPSFTIGADGKVFCLFAAGNTGFFYGLNRIAMCTSDDYGKSWKGPFVIAPASASSAGITFTDHAGLYDYFVTSGKGLYTSDGVLMYLLDAQKTSGGTETNYLLYSADEGATWHVDSKVVNTGANEAKLVEIAPGKLLSSTRSPYDRILNTGSYTKNGSKCTFTWGKQRTEPLLAQGGSGNNQDVIVYNRDVDGSAKVLFHTITSGYGHKTLKLFMSIDKGATWHEVMQVQPGGSRYTVTTVLDNGDLGILFEDYSLEVGNEYPINFLTVKKEQIDGWYADLKDMALVTDVTLRLSSSADIYNLQGHKIPALRKGVNIVRKGDGATEKVMMR